MNQVFLLTEVKRVFLWTKMKQVFLLTEVKGVFWFERRLTEFITESEGDVVVL